MIYPDTSFLCALYRKQDNSERALECWEGLRSPLPVTGLLLWEFRQAARFQAFRHRKDRRLGYPLREAEAMIAKLESHLRLERIRIVECDLHAVLILAERISRLRTPAAGHRSFDLLHVATALELGVAAFWSFDANQNALARSEGLKTPLRIE
jgi:predicted nucleic acid-binding protein